MRKIDIIMPVFNKLEYTKEAIATLRQHTKKEDYHLILVNDASTDATEQFMFQLDRDLNINCIGVVQPQNMGWVKAVNEGMKHAGAEFVLICNNDIHFSEGWLTAMLKHFEDEKVGAVGPISNYVSGIQHVAHNLPTVDSEETKMLIGFFIIFRRSALEKIAIRQEDSVQYYDEIYGMGGGDDLDVSLRLSEAGYKMIISRDVYIHHYGSISFRTYIVKNKLTYEEYWKKGEKLVRKKWGEEKVNNMLTAQHRLHIGVCTPYRVTYNHTKFTKSLFALTKVGQITHIDSARSSIAEIRNLMVKKAIEEGCTHVFFLDDDMVFPHDTLIRLLKHKKDIVGAVAFQRRPEHLPCTFNIDPADPTMLSAVECLDQGLQKFDAIGSACVLIRTSVFKSIPEPWYVWGDKSLGVMVKQGGLGEDLSFCIRARQHGFDVWADTDFVITHLGDEQEIDRRYYEAYKKETNLMERMTGKPVPSIVK